MRAPELDLRSSYVESLYATEDKGLQSIRERLIAAGRWGVNIGANEGRILQILIQLSGAEKIVEIGTLFGYSTVWMARALAGSEKGVEGGKHVFTLEKDPACAEQARLSFRECGVEEHVTLFEGDALQSLSTLSSKGPFDLAFIDANKSAYCEYLDWAEINVKRGGLIIGDNALLGGAVLQDEKPQNMSNRQWQQMRKFNERLADRNKFNATMLPTSEGLSVAIRL